MAIGLQALGGLVVWLLVVAVAVLVRPPQLELVPVLLLFAQIVIVPLGLGLMSPRGALERAIVSGSVFGFRIGGVAALMAIGLPRGEIAAALAALYLVPALAVGFLGVWRIVGGPWRDAGRLGEACAAGFLAVGALFFVLHRQGGDLLGQPEQIIELTAVHFHATGFGLTLMAATLARRLPRWGLPALLLIVTGMVVTPIGFLTAPAVQVAGAVLVVAGLAMVAVGPMRLLGSVGAGARAALLISSGSAALVGALALLYAVTEALGSPAVSIPAMAATHGVAAALGVVGCGLFGWRLAAGR